VVVDVEVVEVGFPQELFLPVEAVVVVEVVQVVED
jgi:hypothetical protein